MVEDFGKLRSLWSEKYTQQMTDNGPGLRLMDPDKVLMQLSAESLGERVMRRS